MISENLRKKILNKKQLSDIVRLWKENKDTIVFTNGCFDIIHPGHVTYLAKAAECGTKLIVGVNTDTSVRKLKGSNRPILDQDARALVLSAFSFVDAVVFFDEDTPLQLIEYILPHVLVKGKDYRNEDIVGYDFVI
jgi:D-glycero-beta-D-manno-heptose 1-phosphate adenylyltransferase